MLILILKVLRLALIALALAAYLVRHSWPELFVFVRLNVVGIVVTYVVVTLTIRILESRRRDTAFGRLLGRLFPGLARTWTCEECGLRNRPGTPECRSCGTVRVLAAWTCEVCETENPGEEARCRRCTVPRPGASP